MADQVKEPSVAPPAQPPEPPKKEEASPPVDELAVAKKQAEEYLNGWKRAMADYANLQKETLRFREEFAKFACAGLIGEMLPVVDAFKKALAAEPKPTEGDTATRKWIDGVKNIRQQLEAALKKAGLTAIEEVGVAFDPAQHEAMMTRKQEDIGSGQVVEVLEPGYRLNDRVIRAAKVVVAE
jgi:molecular chaperone GrpE